MFVGSNCRHWQAMDDDRIRQKCEIFNEVYEEYVPEKKENTEKRENDKKTEKNEQKEKKIKKEK